MSRAWPPNQKPPLGCEVDWSHPLRQGMAGWWLFNERSGPTVYDISGNGNHGTLAGPTWQPGPDGAALDFDGTDDYIPVGAADGSGSLNVTGDQLSFAVRAWVRGVLNNDVMLAKVPDTTWRPGYGIWYSTAGNRWKGFAGSNGYLTSAVFADVPLSTWVHLCVVYNGASITAYRDGRAVTPIAQSGNIGAVAKPLEIGRGASNNYNFNGLLSDVVVYNRALSADEVAWLAAEPYAGVRGPGPRYWWPGWPQGEVVDLAVAEAAGAGYAVGTTPPGSVAMALAGVGAQGLTGTAMTPAAIAAAIAQVTSAAIVAGTSAPDALGLAIAEAITAGIPGIASLRTPLLLANMKRQGLHLDGTKRTELRLAQMIRHQLRGEMR